MAPQWSPDEDRALLLALVQIMAPDGPSKNQFEAVIKAADGRWTLGAATQHYNKKLRLLDPATLGLHITTGGDGAGDISTPATPVRNITITAKKRKAPTAAPATPRTPARGAAAAARTAIKATAAATSLSPSQSPAPAVKVPAHRGGKKKSIAPRAMFPNLGKKKGTATAGPAGSSEDEGDEDEDEGGGSPEKPDSRRLRSASPVKKPSRALATPRKPRISAATTHKREVKAATTVAGTAGSSADEGEEDEDEDGGQQQSKRVKLLEEGEIEE